MATAGTLEYKIVADSSGLSGGLKNAENNVKGFGNKMSAWTVAKGTVLGNLATKAGEAVVDFVKDAVNESMQFDSAMSQVAATMGKSTSEVQDLSAFARQMGAQTAFSATEAAEALNYMALAGYDSETSMAMLPNVLNLAAAGGLGLATASDMVTDAQSALGLSLEETSTMVDQMAKTASKSNTSVGQLGEAFLTIGATARGLAGGTQELSTVLGVLADNGIKGAEGGTHLRNMILSLQTPTKDGTAALQEMGMSYADMYDEAGNMRSLPEIFQQMSGAMEGMNQQQKDAIISGLFNKTDLAAVNALLGTTEERWTELSESIGDSAGAAQQMAETQLDNLEGDVTKFNSALGEAKLSLMQGITPALRSIVQFGTKAMTGLAEGFTEAWEVMGDAWDKTSSTVSDLWDTVSKWANKAYNTTVDFIANVADWFVTIADWMQGKSLSEIAVAIGATVSDWFVTVQNWLNTEGLEIGFNFLATVAGWFDTVSAWLAEKTGLDIATNFSATVSDWISRVKDWLSGTGLDTIGLSFGATVAAWISTVYKWVTDKTINVSLNFLATVADWIDKISGWISDKTGLNISTNFSATVADWITRVNDWLNSSTPLSVSLDFAATVAAWIDKISGWLEEKTGLKIATDFSATVAAWIETINNWLSGKGLDSIGIDFSATVSKWITTIADWIDNGVSVAVSFIGSLINPGSEDNPPGTVLNPEGEAVYVPGESDQSLSEWYLQHHHAKGLYDVPYDNYPAVLHRDERVLTASQARAMDNNSSSESLLAEFQALRHDFRNIQLVVGEKVFGKATVNYGGDLMDGYIGEAENRLLKGYGW